MNGEDIALKRAVSLCVSEYTQFCFPFGSVPGQARPLLPAEPRNHSATFTSPMSAGTSVSGPTTSTNAPQFKPNTAAATANSKYFGLRWRGKHS